MTAPSPASESIVPTEPRPSGVRSTPAPQSTQPNPNLRLILHWITELAILAACWWGWRTGQVPAWAFGVTAGVIGGWLPTSLVLQAVHAVIVARAGGAPASLPAPAPVLPPPATVALLALFGPALRLAATRLGVLVLVVVLAFSAGCPPRPGPTLDGSVTPSAWTDTARVVLTTLGWALPAARAVLAVVLPEPARTVVVRALDAAEDWAGRLRVALSTYETRGGDRCAAHAAAGGLASALVSLAQVLADGGIAFGRPLERVVDSVASLVDTLVPACDRDAGFASRGDSVNAQLRAIEEGARARGVVLRRDLDALRPSEGVR